MQYHRFGAPVSAKRKAVTRDEVLADLERSLKYPSWAARRVACTRPGRRSRTLIQNCFVYPSNPGYRGLTGSNEL